VQFTAIVGGNEQLQHRFLYTMATGSSSLTESKPTVAV